MAGRPLPYSYGQPVIYPEPYTFMKVAGLDVEIKVPAGTFKCVKYEQYIKEPETLEVVQYVCPGVGLIKSELYQEEKLISVSLLKKYKIAAENE
jgi:hypothetical protein